MKLVDDKGIEEYQGVKEAQEKAKKLIKELADVKAYIDGHRLGAEWLRLENEAEFDATQKAVDEALEDRIITGSEAVKMYDMLTKTPLYDSARGQWNRMMSAAQKIENTDREPLSLFSGIIALASIGRADEAKEAYDMLLQSQLYDKERKQWNDGMNDAQKVQDSDRSSITNLLGIIALLSIGRADEAEESYNLLLQSPLYDMDKKQWNKSMTTAKEKQRHADEQLVSIIALASIGRKAEAKLGYEQLTQTEWYDKSCRQWNIDIDANQSLVNSKRYALTQLIGIKALVAIDMKDEAEKAYNKLTKTQLYDSARMQWNWSMSAAQMIEDTERPAFTQLWGVIALAALGR